MATAIQNIQSRDLELEASFMSIFDNTRGANVIKLPSGITSIAEYSCMYRENLALTELPSGITSIGNNAFVGCSNLALTELPSGITSISDNCFNRCSNLALTELPSGITSIGRSAFTYCEKLALTELPSGITSIDYDAFSFCENLKSIKILGGLTTIGNFAFDSCTNLTTFCLPNIINIPTLGGDRVFSDTPIASGTGYIYVPDSLVDSFKTATNWSTYADQIKPISELEAA